MAGAKYLRWRIRPWVASCQQFPPWPEAGILEQVMEKLRKSSILAATSSLATLMSERGWLQRGWLREFPTP